MRFIEFNGLPGCGKTTISGELYNLMGAHGMPPVYYNDVREKFPEGIWKRILHIIFKLRLREIADLYKISLCFDKISFKERWIRILYVEQIAYNYRKFQADTRICIADQGLIQGIISIGYIHDFRSLASKSDFVHRTFEFLRPYYDEILFVSTQIDVKDSYTRLRGRKNNFGRFDKVSDDDLLQLNLKKQEEIFRLIWESCITKGIYAVTINGNDSPKNNAEKVVTFYMDKGKKYECK